MSGWEVAGEVLGDPPPCSSRSQEGRGMKMGHSDEQEAVTVMTLIKSPEKQFSCSLFSGFPSSLRSRVSLVQLLSCVQLLAAPWTAARQASLSTGFSKQENWSGLPCPSPGDLPNPGIEHASLASPALAES